MNQVLTELSKLIREQIDYYSDLLIGGESIGSYEKYREIVGKIAGLVEAESLIADAIANVEKSRG